MGCQMLCASEGGGCRHVSLWRLDCFGLWEPAWRCCYSVPQDTLQALSAGKSCVSLLVALAIAAVKHRCTRQAEDYLSCCMLTPSETGWADCPAGCLPRQGAVAISCSLVSCSVLPCHRWTLATLAGPLSSGTSTLAWTWRADLPSWAPMVSPAQPCHVAEGGGPLELGLQTAANLPCTASLLADL